jgi:hypothetical protein
MSELIPSGNAFYFLSILYLEKIDIAPIVDEFKAISGQLVHFTHSFFPMKDFYSREMGEKDSLRRLIILGQNKMAKDRLVELKIWATKKEFLFSINNKRTINIDVGILSLENVILATGKNFVHRIYLKDGVYADLNLIFKENTFSSLPWTYPDYQHPDFITFFNWSRVLLSL